MDHKEEHQRLWQRTIYNTYDKIEHFCWSSVDHHLLIICWLSSVVIICRSSVAHHLLIMFLYQILLFCYYENWQGDSRDSVVKTPPPGSGSSSELSHFQLVSVDHHLRIICWLSVITMKIHLKDWWDERQRQPRRQGPNWHHYLENVDIFGDLL